jgi:hypothetical protein
MNSVFLIKAGRRLLMCEIEHFRKTKPQNVNAAMGTPLLECPLPCRCIAVAALLRDAQLRQ